MNRHFLLSGTPS